MKQRGMIHTLAGMVHKHLSALAQALPNTLQRAVYNARLAVWVRRLVDLPGKLRRACPHAERNRTASGGAHQFENWQDLVTLLLPKA